MKKLMFIVIFINLQILFFGCATATGPIFKEHSMEEHKGKAIVYFYRNSDIGRISNYDLKINGEMTLKLPNKGYHLLVLDPGAYEFEVFNNSMNLKAKDRFVLDGDKTYFIRYWAKEQSENFVWISILTPRPYSSVKLAYGISLVPRDEALEVIKECRLIEESVPQKDTSE